jgi:hypothetical protein
MRIAHTNCSARVIFCHTAVARDRRSDLTHRTRSLSGAADRPLGHPYTDRTAELAWGRFLVKSIT